MQVFEKSKRLMEKLYVFASLIHHEDTRISKYQEMLAKIEMLIPTFNEACAFFQPEILNLPESDINKMLKEEPSLSLYENYFNKIFKMKAHLLSKEQEEVLAMVTDAFGAPMSMFGALCDADLTFPNVRDEEGNEIELTESIYPVLIRSTDQKVREKAFTTLFDTYSSFKNSFGVSLIAAIRNKSTYAKVRKYSSSLESELSPDNIPTSVYNSTIDIVRENSNLIHRFVDLKKRALGLDEIHMYDLYAPICNPKSTNNYSIEKALELINEGLKPLGSEYLSILNEGIEKRWVDFNPNTGKRGGAYSWATYDSEPYILMNYVNDLNSVFTLAHELGHSIHYYLSNKTQPYIYIVNTLCLMLRLLQRQTKLY